MSMWLILAGLGVIMLCFSTQVIGRASIWHFILPEWKGLGTSEQRRADKAARNAVGSRGWIPLVVVPYWVANSWFNVPYGEMFFVAGFVLHSLLHLVVYWAPLRAECWAILAARGEPICTGCGYDLTVNVRLVC